jgi:hypothetical protein
MSLMGQSRHFDRAPLTSGLARLAEILGVIWHVSKMPIVLQKSKRAQRPISRQDYHCSHWTAMTADRWPDDVRLSDIEPRFTGQACGRRGADVRPEDVLTRL